MAPVKKRENRTRRRILDHIAQAEFIGWPALAESWRRELRRFDARARISPKALDVHTASGLN